MIAQMDTSATSEYFEEILLCARYGDLDDLRQYFSQIPEDLVATILQQQDSRGNTALHLCAANGHTTVASLLLTFQTTGIDLQNEGGNTALHWACLNGHLDTVKCLIEAGADVKIKNKGGRMPIDEAESQGKESIVLWLLALDMKREKDAGIYDGDGKEEDGEEADVNVNLTAGEVEDHDSVLPNAQSSDEVSSGKTNKGSSDKMDTLD